MNYILNRRSIRRTFLTENRLLVAFGVRIQFQEVYRLRRPPDGHGKLHLQFTF